MERVTEKMLQYKIDYLNEITGNPLKPWEKDSDGKMRANIGNYHRSGAYGGVALHQMMNDGGGVNDPFRSGHMPKRELYNRICAMIAGIEYNK